MKYEKIDAYIVVTSFATYIVRFKLTNEAKQLKICQ